MSFRTWRQQLRLQKALELLAEGRPVTSVAIDLGYESPSAFIAMFRQRSAHRQRNTCPPKLTAVPAEIVFCTAA